MNSYNGFVDLLLNFMLLIKGVWIETYLFIKYISALNY